MLNLLSPLALVGGATAAVAALAKNPGSGRSFLSLLTQSEPTSEATSEAAAENTDALAPQFQTVIDKLRKQLTAAGFDTSLPITLSRSATGGIEVGTDHPQWQQLEALFQQQPELGDELAQVLQAGANGSTDFSPQVQVVLTNEASALLRDGQVVATEQQTPESGQL